MVEIPRKREYLMTLGRLQPSLGTYLLLLWILKLTCVLRNTPSHCLGESLESAGLPVDFWKSRIAMIRRRLMVRLPKGGRSQSSCSRALHNISPSSDTWILMHWTRTDGMIWSVSPNFRTVDFASYAQAQEIWGHPLYPHVEFRDTACSVPSHLMPICGLWTEESVLPLLWLSAQLDEGKCSRF